MKQPGVIAFIGSGETTALGGQVFERLARDAQQPLRAAVLETPAGFELNSAQVAGRVAEFIARRLQNDRPELSLIPARRKDSPFSPDDAGIVEPLYQAGLIFLGPGSPTYAARQLAGSLAWDILRARHQAGAAVVFASAAVIAAGRHVLPVYEIYKAGHDPFWAPGLDFMAAFGLHLTFIPHWNNSDGGADLDTSRCFVGVQRFETLRAALPADETIVGIDEHTALVLDLEERVGQVFGRGSVHVLGQQGENEFTRDVGFDISALGQPVIAEAGAGIPPEIYRRAFQGSTQPVMDDTVPPADVLVLLAAREAARLTKDWGKADRLRHELGKLGWSVKDTPQGAVLERLK